MSDNNQKPKPRFIKLLIITIGTFIGQLISSFMFHGIGMETLRDFFSPLNLLSEIIVAFVLAFIILIIIEKIEKRGKT